MGLMLFDKRISKLTQNEPDLRLSAVPHRFHILTRTSSLASGFPYDPRLIAYSVTEKDWQQFSKQVVEAAELPRGSLILWPFRKTEVICKLKKELQYEGDFKRLLNAWNKKNFRHRGFTVSLGLPGPPKYGEKDTAKERRMARTAAKRFTICITSNKMRDW